MAAYNVHTNTASAGELDIASITGLESISSATGVISFENSDLANIKHVTANSLLAGQVTACNATVSGNLLAGQVTACNAAVSGSLLAGQVTACNAAVAGSLTAGEVTACNAAFYSGSADTWSNLSLWADNAAFGRLVAQFSSNANFWACNAVSARASTVHSSNENLSADNAAFARLVAVSSSNLYLSACNAVFDNVQIASTSSCNVTASAGYFDRLYASNAVFARASAVYSSNEYMSADNAAIARLVAVSSSNVSLSACNASFDNVQVFSTISCNVTASAGYFDRLFASNVAVACNVAVGGQWQRQTLASNAAVTVRADQRYGLIVDQPSGTISFGQNVGSGLGLSFYNQASPMISGFGTQAGTGGALGDQVFFGINNLAFGSPSAVLTSNPGGYLRIDSRPSTLQRGAEVGFSARAENTSGAGSNERPIFGIDLNSNHTAVCPMGGSLIVRGGPISAANPAPALRKQPFWYNYVMAVSNIVYVGSNESARVQTTPNLATTSVHVNGSLLSTMNVTGSNVLASNLTVSRAASLNTLAAFDATVQNLLQVQGTANIGSLIVPGNGLVTGSLTANNMAWSNLSSVTGIVTWTHNRNLVAPFTYFATNRVLPGSATNVFVLSEIETANSAVFRIYRPDGSLSTDFHLINVLAMGS